MKEAAARFNAAKAEAGALEKMLAERVVDAGKVCGAGGGGCVVLLIEPGARERVEKAVLDSGGELLPMRIDRQGVTVVSP